MILVLKELENIQSVYYKPASTTNIASPTIKKIVAPVPLGIGLIRGIFS